MKKILYLLVLPLFVACGNTAQHSNAFNSSTTGDSDSICVTDSVDEVVAQYDATHDDYSSQESDVVKEFYVTADVYKVNTTTMEMTYRGKENLHVKLYTNHTAYAVGDNGASMQVYESTQSGYDFMCNVYGNKYIYFFNSDEIQ